jgi:hypothetical protein
MSKPTNLEDASQANNTTNVITQDELNYRVQQAIEAKFKILNTNEIQLACTIRDKKVVDGKPKLDSDGNVTGKWDDSYNVELVFQGGSFSVLVDRMNYELLEANGSHYLASGYVTSKANEYGRMMPLVKISSFTRIY